MARQAPWVPDYGGRTQHLEGLPMVVTLPGVFDMQRVLGKQGRNMPTYFTMDTHNVYMYTR